MPVTLLKKGTVRLDRVTPLFKKGQIQLAIITPTKGKLDTREGFQIRRASVEYGVPCLTSLDTARTLLQVLQAVPNSDVCGCRSLEQYLVAGE